MAPSAAAGTTGLERVLLIFLMKNQQIKLQRTKPSPANDRSSNQSVKNSQTPKNFQERNHNSTPIDSDAKPSQKLVLSTQTYCFSPELPIHRSKTRTNGKVFDLPIETRTNSEKLQLTEQELKRTEKNSSSPNKTQASGEKPQFTEQKLKRTVKNIKLPIKTSNER